VRVTAPAESARVHFCEGWRLPRSLEPMVASSQPCQKLQEIGGTRTVTGAVDSTAQGDASLFRGLANYYNAIEAQDIELNARLRQVDIATRRMTADVSLIKALGGGCQRKDELAARHRHRHRLGCIPSSPKRTLFADGRRVWIPSER
jgi:hypothetical protein